MNKNHTSNISIVIPLFNEVKNIKILCEELKNSLDNRVKYELIFVDDSSTDGTHTELLKLKKKYNFIILSNSSNKGQSYSLFKGINFASNNAIVIMDGDLQINSKDILILLKKFDDNRNSLVSGIRKKRKDKFIKIISSKIANFVRSKILNDDCPDTGCPLKIFNKSDFQKLNFFNGIHRFLPALFRNMNKNILYVEIEHRERIYGKSKYATFDRLFKGLIDLYRVYKIIKNKNL